MLTLLASAVLGLIVQHPPASNVQERLSPIAFLAGHCWAGAFANGGTDTHCFQPVYGGRFIRDVHEVKDPKTGKVVYGGETMYFWGSVEARIRFIYWNSAGGVSEGTVLREGDRLTFAERHADAGQEQQMRNFWTQEGPDQYSVTTQRLKDGVWETSFTMTLRKVRQSL
jgi:hypothetical protein